MLQLTNYQKSYPNSSAAVLHIPHLFFDHHIYWLKGENGCGKTTLLKSIAGLIPFKGNISVNGINIRKQRIHYRKLVNYAEAEPLYPSFLTGNDLIYFYCKTKVGPKQIISELSNMLGIDKHLHQKVSSYSSGMTKKLSLLLAFIGTPALILLDEPFTTLDNEAVSSVIYLINRFHQSGVSFLITSHQSLPFTASMMYVKNKTVVY